MSVFSLSHSLYILVTIVTAIFNCSSEHWFLKMATGSRVKIKQMCDEGEHSMEYWPCLIDIVYYSAKIITKLIENHSLFMYYNSNTHKHVGQ